MKDRHGAEPHRLAQVVAGPPPHDLCQNAAHPCDPSVAQRSHKAALSLFLSVTIEISGKLLRHVTTLLTSCPSRRTATIQATGSSFPGRKADPVPDIVLESARADL
jgi:hypothetical protein